MATRRAVRLAAVLVAAAVPVAAALPAAASAEPTAHPPAPAGHVLRADIQIQKFTYNAKTGITALGTQSAQLSGAQARQQATFSVSKGSTCNVLTLDLKQLNLQLLGLTLVTGEINLKITGQTSQSLGALFCKLSKSLKLTKAVGARAATKSLNKYLHGHPMHALRLRATLPVITAQAAQAPVPACKVLDLVLGPLNLNLLGLVVDLYGADATKPVEVHVTADPAGGILGAVFCKLAAGQAVG